MPIASLHATSLADYLQAEKPVDDAFWFFLHIPKTAGSSFSGALRGAKPPFHRVANPNKKTELKGCPKFTDSLAKMTEKYGGNCAGSGSGHVHYERAKPYVSAIENTRLLTFLRHPVDRTISNYFYSTSEAHPTHERFKRKFPTLQDFVEAPKRHNEMSRYLADDSENINVSSLIAHIERTFSFVGITEMYPMSFNCIFQMLEKPHVMPKRRVRVTSSREKTEAHTDPVLREQIQENNQLDWELYIHFRNLLLEKKPAWHAMRKDARNL